MHELSEHSIKELQRVFPEMDWMKPEDWQTVAAHSDWKAWIPVEAERCSLGTHPGPEMEMRVVLKLKKNRKQIRKDCRSYFGEANVDNINDPEDPTWT